MLVRNTDGTNFAIGAMNYNEDSDTVLSTKIILQIKIAGFMTEAFVDTDSPYVICTPELADVIGFDPDKAEFSAEIPIDGYQVKGHVHKVQIQFEADEDKGESLLVEAFAFAVDEEFDDTPIQRNEIPSSIGFTGCLESVCFAVDGGRRLFYFG